MPTTSLAGDRGRRTRSPRDLTGKAYARLHEEQKAKEEAASLDVAEIRRTALRQGVDAGYDAGFTAGWQAALDRLREAGLDVDSILALDADDAEDE
jgi:hypothetical protein